MDDKLNQPGNISVSRTSELKLSNREKGEPLRVLSEEDWQFWKNNGYVIIPNAVPKDNLNAVSKMLWWFQEMDG